MFAPWRSQNSLLRTHSLPLCFGGSSTNVRRVKIHSSIVSHLLTSCLKRKFFQRQDLLQLNLKYPKFTYPFKLIVRADVKRNLSIPKHNPDHPLAFPIKRAWVRHLFDYLLFSVEIKKGANTVIILVFALLCVTNTTWFQPFSCETSQLCTDPKRGRGDRGKRDEWQAFDTSPSAFFHFWTML